MKKRQGQATLIFENPPVLEAGACIVGKKEGEGPLGSTFDVVSSDGKFGEKTWEKAESRLQKDALTLVLQKAGLTAGDLDTLFAGDLLNQCTGSAFGLRESNRPFLGLYGACSTIAEGILLCGTQIDGGYAQRCLALTSSHFCSSERQYRTPLEYGSQRPETAQWTVTGAGALIFRAPDCPPALAPQQPEIVLTRATVGKIVDLGVKDAFHMGAAMAPAALDTLRQFFQDTNTTPDAYDKIFTGDLGAVGQQLLLDLAHESGLSLASRHIDCGSIIFDREKQDVQAGGSGCGCGASVLCGHILKEMRMGRLSHILFCGTGALLSPTSSLQGESIPSICHLVELRCNPAS